MEELRGWPSFGKTTGSRLAPASFPLLEVGVGTPGRAVDPDDEELLARVLEDDDESFENREGKGKDGEEDEGVLMVAAEDGDLSSRGEPNAELHRTPMIRLLGLDLYPGDTDGLLVPVGAIAPARG